MVWELHHCLPLRRSGSNTAVYILFVESEPAFQEHGEEEGSVEEGIRIGHDEKRRASKRKQKAGNI